MSSDLPLFQFGGTTYVPSLDRERLGEQFCRVVDCMADGCWRSLREIARVTDDPEASISARLRDVRKHWGTDAMESRRRPSVDARRGHWQYKVHAPEGWGR
jgi:hypothetical protein